MDNDALKQLLQYRWELFGFIRSLVRDTAAAEDVFQEVSAAIVRRPPGEEEIRNFRAWAREVARRQVLKYFRDNPGRREISVPPDAMVDLAAQAFSEENLGTADCAAEHDALRECLRGVGPRASELMRLRFVAGRGYDDIARAVRRSEAAVRKAVTRTRMALLDCVTRRLRLARQGS